MAARYWVLVSDELMDSDPRWPEGFRPVERGSTVWLEPGVRWWLFEDDDAPPGLDGKPVEVTAVLEDGKPVIVRRPPGVQTSWLDLARAPAVT